MTAAPCACHRASLIMAPLQCERMLQTVVTCVPVSQASITDLATCILASIPAIRGITHATLVLPIAPMAGREVRAAVEGVPRAVIQSVGLRHTSLHCRPSPMTRVWLYWAAARVRGKGWK